jgi:serine/threonine protein kinase
MIMYKRRYNTVLSARFFVKVMAGILKALILMQGHGFVYLDLKPDNICVAADGTGVLTDFGHCVRIASESLIGDLADLQTPTPAYCGPEFFTPRQIRRITAKADVWSFGAVLFRIFTNCLPISNEPFNVEDDSVEPSIGYFQARKKIMKFMLSKNDALAPNRQIVAFGDHNDLAHQVRYNFF